MTTPSNDRNDIIPSPPNVMEPLDDDDPEAGLEDEPIHDQLPSVEEARANADLDNTDPKGDAATRKSRFRFCCFTCCCLCGAFLFILILAITVPQMASEGNQNKHHNSDKGQFTLAPGAFEPRFDGVRDFLTGFSNASDLDREDSPQRRAAQWVADEDMLHLSMDDENFLERYALATMYYAMEGSKWPLHLSFLTPKHVCDWFHIGFGSDDKPRYVGAHCEEGQKVQELFFPEKWLKGAFPDELRLLEDLRFVSVYRNSGLAGEFPSVFRKLPKLEYLALHFCGIKGQLPDWLGEMTSLTSLVLSNNDFTGTVPPSISKLTNLKQLFLDDNAIAGDIKLLENLTNLEALLLEDNFFEGAITESMVKTWQALEIMDVSSNNLTGTIPPTLFTLPNLTVFDGHANGFTGALPDIPHENHEMKFLGLHDNAFTGPIPSTISNLAKLTHLDLSSNQLSGAIPEDFFSMTEMKYLFLALNPAFQAGSIPTFLERMTKLEDLSLKETSRIGTIPHWIGNMTSLVLLDLDSNSLTGTIGRVIGDLSNLKFLLLDRNDLHGTIPNSFSKLTGLDFLMLERNSLNGTAKPICDREQKPQVFMADCAEMQCPCCSACCADDQTDDKCDDQVWLGGVDPIWETKYERTFYQFEKVKLKPDGKIRML